MHAPALHKIVALAASMLVVSAYCGSMPVCAAGEEALQATPLLLPGLKPEVSNKTKPPVNQAQVRIPRPGEVKQESQARIPRPGEVKQESQARIPRPGEIKQDTPPRSARPGEIEQDVAAPKPAPAPARAPGPIKDQYPAIGNLESITLGQPHPDLRIEDRLADLEQSIFKKTFPNDSLFDRTERLKRTIIGADASDVPSSLNSNNNWIDDPHPALESAQEVHYLDAIAALPENNESVSAKEASQFLFNLINNERKNYGLQGLANDDLADKMSLHMVQDLVRRDTLSHYDAKGDNPDRRLTLLDGADAVSESVTSCKMRQAGIRKLTRAAMAETLKIFLSRQDDRDAILNADASHLSVSSMPSQDGGKVYTVMEIITRHSLMLPVPKEMRLGEKLDLKGVVQAPFNFDKITIAWEAENPDAGNSVADDSEEALPYFPPLDYIAFSNRSEQNHDRAIAALKVVGMAAAIAGGLFIPPVALAAPLIAVAGSGGEVKPISDIPIKGGIRVDGGEFSGRITLSNDNKPGLYYVTVWANIARGQKSFPVSRRVIRVVDTNMLDNPGDQFAGNEKVEAKLENPEEERRKEKERQLQAKKEAKIKEKLEKEARDRQEQEDKERQKRQEQEDKIKKEIEDHSKGEAKKNDDDKKADEKENDEKD